MLTTSAPVTARAVRGRPAPRWRVLLAAAVGGALVVGSGTVLVVRDVRRLAVAEELGVATRDATAAISSLGVAVSGARATLESSAGRVDEERARADLAAAIEAASAAARAAGTSPDEIAEATGRVVAARDALEPASDAVRTAVARWELAGARAAWSEAAGRLDAAISVAQGVLESSAGRVPDDAVRGSLATELDAARTVRGADEPMQASDLTAEARALAGAVDSLAAPQAAVSAAVESWERARAAAVVGAAQAPAAPKERQAPTGRQAPPAPSSPPVVPRPSPSAEGSHWETTVTYEDLGICMDTEGNSWEC